MNLGQLIGELRMAADVPSGGLAPQPVHVDGRRNRNSNRRAEILAFAKERGEISAGDLVQIFGMQMGNATMFLSNLARTGELKRLGRGRYEVSR